MSLPARLPKGHSLVVKEDKIVVYLLNLKHKDGASKAKFFRNRGFKSNDWEHFATALRDHGASQPVTSVVPTKHGRKFTVECQLLTPDGRNPCILSVWVESKRKSLALVTAHPNRA